MAKTERAPWYARAGNVMTTTLLRAGVKLNGFKKYPMYLMTVRGRKSGQPRTTPVVIGEHDGLRLVISVYGQVDWARNLRAAGKATLQRGRRNETVTAVELGPAEAAPILKRSLAGAPGMIRAYFEVTPDSSLEDFEREAPRHPVFLLQRAA